MHSNTYFAHRERQKQRRTPAVSRADSRSEARAEAVGVGSSALFGAGMGRDSVCPSWRGQPPLPLIACPAGMSVVATHQTKTLRRRAYGRLGGQKERQRDDFFRGLDPFALAKHALALRGRRPTISVTTGPGMSSFTLILSGHSSCASTRVSIHNPAFAHA